MPATGDVLKSGVATPAVREPVATHTLDEITVNAEPVFGCPMLSRTKLALPFAGGNHAPRCALGWSVHNEREAAYCLATPDHVLCWKAHPERLAEIDPSREDRAAVAD